MRLVVLFGGESAEHEVSCVTAAHVLGAADPDRYELEPVGITRDGTWVRADEARAALGEGTRALPGALEAVGTALDHLDVLAPRPGEQVVVFPLLHGPRGEDGTVQGLAELAGVPYVGCGVLASALAMDKAKAKEVLAQAGLPQGRFAVQRCATADAAPVSGSSGPGEQVAQVGGYPVFVKPANMGSSIGVSRVEGPDGLAEAVALAGTYDEWVVIEEAIAGREIEVGILGDLDPQASVPGEVRSASSFYDYEDKYLDGRAELLVPAPLDDVERDEVRHLALRAFAALRGAGLARVDFFFEEGGRGFLVNEVNTIPGFTPISMYPRLWEATGVAYPELIDRLVALALSRHERHQARRSASRRPSLHRTP